MDRRTGRWADKRSGGRADCAVRASIARTAGRADGRTGERAGGPGFKRPHSMRLGSLLGAQFACLVRARVRRVPGSVVVSSMIPRQTPVLRR